MQENRQTEKALCQVCGEPMPEGEEMFNYHGYSCDCPKPPLKKQETVTDSKIITTSEHPSGRKDVNIEVKMLDVKEDDADTIKAKEVIENKVIPALANVDVLVIVVHKPSNQEAHKVVKLPHVRAFAEAAVKAHGVGDPADYVIVEHHITNGTVKISTL